MHPLELSARNEDFEISDENLQWTTVLQCYISRRQGVVWWLLTGTSHPAVVMNRSIHEQNMTRAWLKRETKKDGETYP